MKLFLTIILLNLNYNCFSQAALSNDIADSIQVIIDLDTMNRKRRLPTVPNLSPDYMENYMLASFVDFNTINNKYKQIPPHFLGNTYGFKYRKRKKFEYENMVNIDTLVHLVNGDFYIELTINKTYKLIRRRKNSNKQKIKKEKIGSYSLVKGISGLAVFDIIKNDSLNLFFRKDRAIRWLLKNALNDELKFIVMNFNYPTLQYYSYLELHNRGQAVSELHKHISNEYVLIASYQTEGRVNRLNEILTN